MRNLNKKMKTEKLRQKSDLGRSWAPFGKGLGRSGPSFGYFWGLLDRFFGVLNQAFFKHKSKMGSKRPFGSILGGSWRDLDEVWGGFGSGLGRNFKGFGRFCADSGGVCVALLQQRL